eukprot:CAMPEP_0178414198 /NCGR_PEP_ID=MMETSP0689_2-20121128/22913_1 /TAXON_ID=160604 /ORGANISM="Amphidinium massartii, Strain CS-259" /LENGTH=115 /DNA_ID=CAMNT_0020035481 /DNA_START=97 /DNA_END=441 /DNA_ORIENTATION=+
MVTGEDMPERMWSRCVHLGRFNVTSNLLDPALVTLLFRHSDKPEATSVFAFWGGDALACKATKEALILIAGTFFFGLGRRLVRASIMYRPGCILGEALCNRCPGNTMGDSIVQHS